MSYISDEKLMAYADDELTSAERTEVEAAILADAGVESRLAVFVETRLHISGLYDKPMRQPVPDHLLDLVLLRSDRASSRPAIKKHECQNQTGITHLFKNSFLQGRSGYTGVMAFGLALVIGGVAGWQFGTAGQHGSGGGMQTVAARQGDLVAPNGLSRALNTTASGQKLSWSGATAQTMTLEPVFTFRTVKNTVCRQYRLGVSSGKSFRGLACRLPDGQWSIPVHLEVNPGKDNGGKIIPAAGGGSVIDKIIDRLIDGDVLDVAEEEKMIRGKWVSRPGTQ